MTRHNLASHISWLLSNENTPPVGVPAIASNHSAVAAEVSYAGLAEEDTNQPISRTSVNPPVTQSVNVGQGFQRPALPSTDSQNPRVRDQTKSVVEESMGRLSSTSRSTRPGLVIQNQLATPASTTGSSSLTQGYATFLRASNGESKAVKLLHIPLTEFVQARHLQGPSSDCHRISQDPCKPHRRPNRHPVRRQSSDSTMSNRWILLGIMMFMQNKLHLVQAVQKCLGYPRLYGLRKQHGGRSLSNLLSLVQRLERSVRAMKYLRDL
jgi:hypothetical protein